MPHGTVGAVPAGLNVWSVRPRDHQLADVICGPDVPGTRLMVLHRDTAEVVVAFHNAEVEAARQPRATVGDVESLLTRVLAAALRELLTPRWWRRLRRAR